MAELLDIDNNSHRFDAELEDPSQHDPLVSVILIFFNCEAFLQEAIDSVLAQTYRNWELLLIDDGSTDKSTDIAKNAMHLHPCRIRYFDHIGHRNKGMSASRNEGFRRS